MHKNFGEWYRQASLSCSDESLKNRWAGVSKWVSTIRGDIVALLETVRIFRGFPARTSRDGFLEAFREQDAAFPQRNNDYEQQLLAGAALVHLVGSHKKVDDEETLRAAVIAATALEVSGLGAINTNGTLEEQAGEVSAGLHSIAQRQRQRRPFSAVLLSAEEEPAFKKSIATDISDFNQLRSSYGEAFESLLEAITRSEKALAAVAHGLRCADEETNILWWLAGGASRELGKPWDEVKDAAPLVAAWELAQLTDVALGPQNATALLNRALADMGKDKSKKHPLHVYVNAAPDDWATTRSKDFDSRALDLAPLSLAISKRVDGNTKDWQPLFESVSGDLKAGLPLAPEDVARQAYMEAILFRALTHAEG